MEVQNLGVDVQWRQRLHRDSGRDLSRRAETRSPTVEGWGRSWVLTPDVMMTDWKRSNTGLMASEASMQL